jgi:hypothetical protein
MNRMYLSGWRQRRRRPSFIMLRSWNAALFVPPSITRTTSSWIAGLAAFPQASGSTAFMLSRSSIDEMRSLREGSRRRRRRRKVGCAAQPSILSRGKGPGGHTTSAEKLSSEICAARLSVLLQTRLFVRVLHLHQWCTPSTTGLRLRRHRGKHEALDCAAEIQKVLPWQARRHSILAVTSEREKSGGR